MSIANKITIVECPRDAMQGIVDFIPIDRKINYINSLIKVGFDIIDFGSFVSPKSVPQMRSTDKVLSGLRLKKETELLAIVLNLKGAIQALSCDGISILGYPLSISEIFQYKNSNKDIISSLSVIDQIHNLCLQKNKKLLVYFSMAFGNPYQEYWGVDILMKYIDIINKKSIKMISLADTIGNSTPEGIKKTYANVLKSFPLLDIGLHLHSKPKNSYDKISSGWNAGCRRFDTTISGYGGCPFAQDKLIGNIPTETLLNFIACNKLNHSLNPLAFESASNQAKDIFN